MILFQPATLPVSIEQNFANLGRKRSGSTHLMEDSDGNKSSSEWNYFLLRFLPPIYMHLIFDILHFEILRLMNWIFFPVWTGFFSACVVFKNPVHQTRYLKIENVKYLVQIDRRMGLWPFPRPNKSLQLFLLSKLMFINISNWWNSMFAKRR